MTDAAKTPAKAPAKAENYAGVIRLLVVDFNGVNIGELKVFSDSDKLPPRRYCQQVKMIARQLIKRADERLASLPPRPTPPTP